MSQPRRGFQDGGAAGLAKGIGKGVGGLLIKPQAGEFSPLGRLVFILIPIPGIWGLLGYPLHGISRGIERSYGEDRRNYIVKSRIRQGLEEWESASQEERDEVLDKWQAYEKGVRIKQGAKVK